MPIQIALDSLKQAASGTANSATFLRGDNAFSSTITNPTLTLQSENVSPFIGFRNRIINGAMMIDQRNAGAAITGVTSAVTYMCDRWYFQAAGGATVTIQQSTTAPTGFTHSAYATVTSSGTPSYGFIQQNIEGNNIIGLNMGSNDSRITVSFWVRSSITGTYSVSVQDSTYGNSYNATYSISASNTWEYKSVTIPGYSGGTWNTTNTQGFSLRFALISSAGGTPNTWVSSSHNGSTNNVNWFGTNGATFYITGVQLEKGSVATSFDYRPYGTELALCQRYYHFLGGDTSYQNINTVVWFGAGDCVGAFRHPVEMRAAPTIGKTGTWHALGGAGAAGQTISSDQNGPKTVQLGATGGSSGVSGQAATLRVLNESSFRLTFSAEL